MSEQPKFISYSVEDIQNLLKHEYGGTSFAEEPQMSDYEMDIRAWDALNTKIEEYYIDLQRYSAALEKIAYVDPLVHDSEAVELFKKIARDALEHE